jgi:hypothetical protein
MFLAFKRYGAAEAYADETLTQIHPGDLPLDRVNVARRFKVNYAEHASRMFPWLLTALALISDIDSFQALFQTPFSEIKIDWAQRSSDRYFRHLDQLRADGLIEEERSGTLKFLSKYFAISKKDLTARAIFNGRKLSRLQKTPDPVNLPEVPDVLKTAAHLHDQLQRGTSRVLAPSVYVADIRHYFHEISVSPDIAKYFGVMCRGVPYSWRGLPMGWAHSPRIAQCLAWSLVLYQAPQCLLAESQKAASSAHPPSFVFSRDPNGACTGIIFIWYDNLVILCYNNDHFRAIVKTINDNRKSYNLVWSSEYSYSPSELRLPEPTAAELATLPEGQKPRYPSFLGVKVRVDFSSRTRGGDIVSRLVWKCDDRLYKRMSQIHCDLDAAAPSRRSIARSVGYLIWAHYVYCIPLVRISEVIDVARRNIPKRFSRNAWNETSTISKDDISTLQLHLSRLINDNSWHHYRSTTFENTDLLRIVTDSSDDFGAYVFLDINGNALLEKKWRWDTKSRSLSIFLKELLAATIALEHASTLKRPIHLAVDNSAAGFVIRRGLSLNSAANEMLSRIFAVISPQQIQVTHIRSCDNAADPLTRGLSVNVGRNMMSIQRMLESEAGWPKTTANPAKYVRGADDDGESDADTDVTRHREDDEDDGILACIDCEYQSDDDE